MTFLNKLRHLKYLLKKNLLKTKRNIPIYIFSYHKVGTKLLAKVFHPICLKYGWSFKNYSGKTNEQPEEDVVIFLHSQVDFQNFQKPFIGLHLIRDPRDIIVSGFLYHRRTGEEWCTNKYFSTEEPILYPRVPFSQEHRPEHWKRNYLNSLKGKSYQENINDLSDEDGIIFEMDHYGKWTLEDMRKWDFTKNEILEIRFEDLMSNYDQVWDKILTHFQFNKKQIKFTKRMAKKEDLNAKSNKSLQKDKHIYSRETRKWPIYFNERIKKEFLNRFKGILIELRYEDWNEW